MVYHTTKSITDSTRAIVAIYISVCAVVAESMHSRAHRKHLQTDVKVYQVVYQ